MEVRLSGTCGLSDDHVVSISAGTTRKLSTAGTLLKKPMRFPNLLRSDCKVLVIKVLRQEASVPLVLHPDGEEYCVDVPRSGGEAASLLLALRDSGAEEAATTAASDAASCAAGPAEASEYLAQRGVLPYVHRLLEALAVSRPQRPFEFMLEQLSMLCRVPEAAKLHRTLQEGRLRARLAQEAEHTAGAAEEELRAEVSEAERRAALGEEEVVRLSSMAAQLKYREGAAAAQVAELRASNEEIERRAVAAEEEVGRLSQEAARLQAREGAVARAEAGLRAGSARAEREARRREEAAAAERTACMARIAELGGRVEQLELEAAQLRQHAEALSAREAAAAALCSELRAQGAAAEAQLQALDAEAARLAAETGRLGALQGAAERGAAALRGAAEQRARSAEAGRRLQHLQEGLQQLQESEDAIVSRVAELQEKQRAAEEEAARLSLHTEELRRRLRQDAESAAAMRELESQAKAQAIAATSETTAQAARNAEAESRLQQLHQLMEQLTAQAAGLKSDEDAAASRVAELRIDVQMAESGAKAAATEMRAMEEQAKALTVVAESETAAQAARNVEAESRQQQLHLDMQRLITEAACLKSREDAAASRVAELQVENVTADSRGKAAEEEVARLVRHLELRNAEVESRLQKLHLDMQRLTTEATGLKGREDAAASRMAELQAESATADSRVKAAEEEGAEAERRLQQAEAECRLRSAAARAAEEDIERLTAEAADLQSREGAAVKRKDELLRANAEVLSRTKAAEGEAQQLCLQAAQLQSLEQSTARAVAEAAERQARGHLEAKDVRAREEATAKRRLELQAESAEAERRAEAAAADSAAAKARHEAAVQEGAERLRAAEEEAASLKAQADALSRKQAEAERTVAALKVCNAEAEGCVHAREQEVVSPPNEASELKAREGAAERAVEALSAAAACSPAAAEREQEAAPASAPDRDAETQRRDVVERRLKELEVSREHLAGEMEELETRAEAVAEEVRCLQARAEEAKGRLQEEEAEAALLSMRAAQQRSREETVRRVHEQASRLVAQEGELGLRELAAARRLEELKASSREAQRRALAAEREVEGLAAGYEELLQRERAASQLAEGLRAQTADAKLQGTEGCPSPLLQHQSVDSTRCDPCETSLGSLRNQSLESAPLDPGDDRGLPARELPEGARSPELERSVSRTRSRMLQHLAWSHGQLAPAAAASAGGGGRRRGWSQSPARASAGHQVPRLHHLGPGASSRAEPPGPRAAAELRAAALARPRSPAGLLPAQQGRLRSLRTAPPLLDPGLPGAVWQGFSVLAPAAAHGGRGGGEHRGGRGSHGAGPVPAVEQPAGAPEVREAEAEAPAAPREGPGEVVLAALCARRCAAEEAEEEREGVAAPSARESTAEQESGPALCARQSAAELAAPAQVEQESGPALCARQSAAELASPAQEPVLADGAQREQVRRVRVWVKDLHEVCRVSFEYGDGTARAFGQDGGLEQFPFVVPPGEHIVKLHSRCRHETTGTLLGTPYMHEGCCFETNQDRRSLWYGGNGGTLSTFTASDGHHITGFNTLGGLKSGVPIGIEEQTLVSMHDLACAGHLCDLTLTSIRQLAIENDSWYELQTRQELERVTTRGAAEPGQYVASFEEMRHREDMYDAVARDDQDAWENLAQGSDLAGADFQRLREVWKEAAQLGSQASRTGVCEAIAEAARDNVLCLSCGGQGCGLCRARDFLSWARRRLATEVQERQEPEWTAARVAPPQVSTADRGPLCAFQHFSHQRAERAAIS